jgi:hypothetical protein
MFKSQKSDLSRQLFASLPGPLSCHTFITIVLELSSQKVSPYPTTVPSFMNDDLKNLDAKNCPIIKLEIFLPKTSKKNFKNFCKRFTVQIMQRVYCTFSHLFYEHEKALNRFRDSGFSVHFLCLFFSKSAQNKL